MKKLKNYYLIVGISACIIANSANAESQTQIGLYRTFERSIENNNTYSNKFIDVELNCTYISPSDDSTEFMGFYDGDGAGGGDLTNGNVWKIRFLPDEVGEWLYKWEWSDTTTGGEGTFICDSSNAGKGIIRPYKENPHWFAYNGTEPVWLKSYYESGHGSIAQPFDWLSTNVYQVLIDNGYNHFQVNWLLSLCCFSQYYTDGPAQSTTDLTLYQNGNPSSTMRLDVWQMMERNISWLNDKNIGLFMFLGFNGGRNGGPDWTILSDTEKDFYVRYVLARLAPFANIAGWNYTWEVEGNTENGELGCMRLVQKYDVFDHLRTYQDEKPKYNEFSRPEYNFAGIENHRIHSDNREPEYWSAPWTHHEACLLGYVPGKPVYMVEGNSLWRRYWVNKIIKETGKTVTQAEFRQSAWGCATAAASFTWCGHQGSGDLTAYGPQGLPFHGDENEYAYASLQVDILTNVMNNELAFYKMNPSDSLLSDHDSHAVWCLSEPGEQYLIFSKEGSPFKLKLSAGEYNNNQWVSAMTGAGIEVPAFTASENEIVSFTPPDSNIDWVLIIRKDGTQNIQEEANFLSAETDTTGMIILLSCNKEISIPDGYSYGFTIKEKAGTGTYSLKEVTTDSTNKSTIIIELNSSISYNKQIVLSYVGTLEATDSCILAPIKDMNVKNNSKSRMPVASVNELQKTSVKVYPIPCKDQLQISFEEKIDKITFYNVSGVAIFEKSNVNQSDIRISLNDIPAGNYVLSINTDNSIVKKSFIKN